MMGGYSSSVACSHIKAFGVSRKLCTKGLQALSMLGEHFIGKV